MQLEKNSEKLRFSHINLPIEKLFFATIISNDEYWIELESGTSYGFEIAYLYQKKQIKGTDKFKSIEVGHACKRSNGKWIVSVFGPEVQFSSHTKAIEALWSFPYRSGYEL